MSDLAILRLVRAARRAMPSFHIAGSAVSAGFLAWLTTSAAAGAAKDAPDNGSEKPDASGHDPGITGAHGSKSGAAAEADATTANGVDGAHAEHTTGRGQSDDAHSESAANGKSQDAGATGVANGTSVGSSTNPAILSTDQTLDAGSTAALAAVLLTETQTPAKTLGAVAGNAVNDVQFAVPDKQTPATAPTMRPRSRRTVVGRPPRSAWRRTRPPSPRSRRRMPTPAPR